MPQPLLAAVLLIASLSLGCAAGIGPLPPVAGPAEGGGLRLLVLGRAQDGGMPHLGCEREACCARARRSGRVETPACLGVHDARSGALLLIEATPAIEQQVARLHALAGVSDRGRRPVDAVLLTHAHVGHYIGLAQLGREVAATARLPVWTSPRLAAFLHGNGPWSQLVALEQIALREVAPGSDFLPLADLRVQAIAVPHRDEFSDTMAFKLRGPRRCVLFVPDIDAWDRAGDGMLERLLDGVDVAYVDGTFYDGRELPERLRSEIPHPPMVDTMQRLAGFARTRPGAVRFLHLNHTNPALHDAALQRAIAARGFRVAEVGEIVEL